jgi:protein-disulfide isomerase
MKVRLLIPSALLGVVLLSACSTVDTTGISATSSRGPHPKTNLNASVTVTEFGDLQCPACRGAQPIVKQIIEKYGEQIKFEFKHFPLQAIHPYTMVDAEASECAADQGKFWEYEELAYEKQPDLNNEAPAAWAKQLGLNMDLFGRCTQSHIKKSEILADYDEGSKLGVNGTPTFFVNGQKVQSTVESIMAAIDASLNNIKNVPL